VLHESHHASLRSERITGQNPGNGQSMNQPLKEIIYSSAPLLNKPWDLICSMKADLLASCTLAWRLLIRNISAQYRQTILGYLWAFIPPVFVTAIWVFLNSSRILNIEDTGMPYPLFALTGIVLWQTFVDAVNSPLNQMNESRAMLAKVNFPREALILAGLGEVLFSFAIRVLLLAVIFIYYRHPLPETLWLAPFGIVVLISMGLMTGVLMTPLGMLYKDIGRGMLILTQVWFFLTPVIYPLPEDNFAADLLAYNPVTPVLVTTRDWITTGNSDMVVQYVFVSVITLVMVFAGWLLYRLAMPHLISRISA